MHILKNIPAVETVLAKYPDARNTYIVCENIGEYADTVSTVTNRNASSWTGNMGASESLRCLREGDMSGVPAADKMLAEIEDSCHFDTRAWRVIDDVVGATPNIPAFIAGVPQNMRRRQRTTSERAPLSIMVDLTSSGGIKAHNVQRRGCAILALVRLLCNVRTVELWAIVGLGKSNSATEICTRIDTTPLDLARTAHMLTHPSVSRMLGYDYLEQKHNSGPAWNYGDIDLQRATGREALARVVNPANDVLYLPPVYLADDNIPNPAAWLKKMLALHGGLNTES